MSSPLCWEHREQAGKTIRRVRWSNGQNYDSLTIDFTDNTQVSFRLSLVIDEEAGLCDLNCGSLRQLVPIPVRGKIEPLE
jgi:hypothetical protein